MLYEVGLPQIKATITCLGRTVIALLAVKPWESNMAWGQRRHYDGWNVPSRCSRFCQPSDLWTREELVWVLEADSLKAVPGLKAFILDMWSNPITWNFILNSKLHNASSSFPSIYIWLYIAYRPTDSCCYSGIGLCDMDKIFFCDIVVRIVHSIV